MHQIVFEGGERSALAVIRPFGAALGEDADGKLVVGRFVHQVFPEHGFKASGQSEPFTYDSLVCFQTALVNLKVLFLQQCDPEWWSGQPLGLGDVETSGGGVAVALARGIEGLVAERRSQVRDLDAAIDVVQVARGYLESLQ